MARRSRCADCLLVTVNLLLMMLGGASLVTAARLWWDPFVAAPLRALLPVEHIVLTVLLTAVPLALWLLAILAYAGLSSKTRRRRRLRWYVVLMALLMCAQAAAIAWFGVHVYQLIQQKKVTKELTALFKFLADGLKKSTSVEKFLTETVGFKDDTIEKIKKNYPNLHKGLFTDKSHKILKNVPVSWSKYVGAACALLAVVLQLLAALLAGLAARRAPAPRDAAKSTKPKKEEVKNLPPSLARSMTKSITKSMNKIMTKRDKDSVPTMMYRNNEVFNKHSPRSLRTYSAPARTTEARARTTEARARTTEARARATEARAQAPRSRSRSLNFSWKCEIECGGGKRA